MQNLDNLVSDGQSSKSRRYMYEAAGRRTLRTGARTRVFLQVGLDMQLFSYSQMSMSTVNGST